MTTIKGFSNSFNNTKNSGLNSIENHTPSSSLRGILEIDERRNAFIRQLSLEIDKHPSDPRVAPEDVRRWKLREGCQVEYRKDRGRVIIDKVDGLTPAEWSKCEEFSNRTAIDPFERINLTTGPGDTSMRVVDLLCPLGKGQRALIVAPPRSGKTMLMQALAKSISENHAEIDLIVLLVDERPEEVTDMRRTIRGEVFASSSDSARESHVRLAQLVLSYARRKTEAGRDVVLLLDSITKMGRAFNSVQQSSGRTLSGGMDSRALEIPKRIFGAARALEGGGSLTIVATALVQTNSRMDDLIFEEFKGTGNMEIVLNRDLANERIFPAINIPDSGTRHEELLFGRETQRYQGLRRALHKKKPREAMLAMLRLLEQFDTNRKILAQFSKLYQTTELEDEE
ncbi:MAG TPA: transcription termination factor Rho [Bacteroidota bacterium]|nr:transcription termination factor Rho [Bacteroidota bacterium]